MIDKLNHIYLKIAPTKLDDRVAYSVTYNYDIIPKGELTYTQYFVQEHITTVLINGYPYVSYEELGLENEEEAYFATQLAVYEVVSRMQYDNISNGTFSLDKIIPSDEKYQDMVERILNKAKELANNALENTYVSSTEASFCTSEVEFDTDGNETKVGPFYTKNEANEYVNRFFKGDSKSTTQISARNFIENSNVKIVDRDGNEISNINTGDPFYVKVIGNEQYFIQLKVEVNTKNIYTEIYSSGDSKKQYVILDDENVISKTITAVKDNIDTGIVNIEFKDQNGEMISGVKYYILDERGETIQDIDGFSSKDKYMLPLGNYSIKQYNVPGDYILNQNVYEFSITKDGEEVELEIIDETIDAFLS